MAYQFSGHPYKGIDYINKAITLNPFPPSDYLVQLGIANLTAQKHQEAIEAFKRGIQIEPKNIFAHIGLVNAYIESGNDKEAFNEVKSVIAIDPNFSVENFTKVLPYKNTDYNKRYAASLRKAGLPDWSFPKFKPILDRWWLKLIADELQLHISCSDICNKFALWKIQIGPLRT